MPDIAEKEEARDVKVSQNKTQARAPSRLVGWPAFAGAVMLMIAFVALLAVGVMLPVMELHMDMPLLYVKKPKLKAVESFIESLNLPSLMHNEVSSWTCLLTLSSSTLKGEVNAGLAFILYGVFTILLPLLDMLALLVAAWRMRRGSLSSSDASEFDGPREALAISHVLKKLSMLDVSLMGVVVVVLSLQNMKNSGVILGLQRGWPVLLAAEICHYTASFVVNSAYRSWREARGHMSDAENAGLEDV